MTCWRVLGVVLLAGLASSRLTVAAPPTAQQAAAADGAATGATLLDPANSRNFSAKAMLPATAASGVPVYTGTNATVQTSGSMTGQFANGKGNSVPAGTAASASCDTSTDLDCRAVQLVKGMPDLQGTKNSLQSQSLVTRENAIGASLRDPTATPPATAGDLGATTASICSTNTTTMPAQYETKVCTDYANPGLQSCAANQTVTVDPDFLYQCVVKTSADVGVSCSVGQVVTVDADANYQCQVKPRAERILNCDTLLNVTVTQDTCTPVELPAAAIGGVTGCNQRDGHDYLYGWAVKPYSCTIKVGTQNLLVLPNGIEEGYPGTVGGCGSPGIVPSQIKPIGYTTNIYADPIWAANIDVPEIVNIDYYINMDGVAGIQYGVLPFDDPWAGYNAGYTTFAPDRAAVSQSLTVDTSTNWSFLYGPYLTDTAYRGIQRLRVLAGSGCVGSLCTYKLEYGTTLYKPVNFDLLNNQVWAKFYSGACPVTESYFQSYVFTTTSCQSDDVAVFDPDWRTSPNFSFTAQWRGTLTYTRTPSGYTSIDGWDTSACSALEARTLP